MARTHSSHTGSPARMRSPARRTARRSSSADGSEYEMDLDALGLDSTFQSTALDGGRAPHVDRVDTSEVEGPEDFTMNMTYWMTADVPAARATASTASSPTAPVHSSTAAPTERVHGAADTPASERSMANSEKVRSFLSALPDTELDHPPAGTPLRVPVLRAPPPKARARPPTVEDQQDVHRPAHPPTPPQHAAIRHPAPPATPAPTPAQQHLAARTRITELETILAYTRAELDSARTDGYQHKDHISRLQGALQQHDTRTEQASAEKTELLAQLTAVQARADSLQVDLARATADARAAREDAQARVASEAASKTAAVVQLSRIAGLETQLQDARFSLECAHADVAAKEQLFHTNIHLNGHVRALRSELEAQRTALADLSSAPARRSTADEQLQAEVAAKDRLIDQHVTEKDGVERQLSTALGRIAGLENSLTTLRTQLANADRETGTARAEAERLTHDLSDANDRLVDARAEADRRVADVEKKLARVKDLKAEAESRFQDLKSQHDDLKSQHDDLAEGHAAMLEDVRDKAEDAVRKTGALLAQERKEKARLKKDAERLQRDIENLRTEQEHEHEHEHPTRLASDSDTANTTPPAPASTANDDELAALKSIIKAQLTDLKTLKSTHKSTLAALTTSHASALTTLRTQLATARHNLASQARDHAAVNTALDEQLATLLSALMKERARSVVGRRDGQWEEVQRRAAGEREVLGKVLMRQWGREECGEGKGEGGQVYRYKYAKRGE